MGVAKELEGKISKTDLPERIELRLELAYQIRQTDAKKSMEHSLSAYKEAVLLEDSALELRSLFAICTAALYNDNFEKHDLWIKRLLKRGIELDDRVAIARAYIFMYRWAWKQGELSSCAEYLTSALDYLDQDSAKTEKATCLTGLGNIYFKLEQYDKALYHYESAIPLVKNDLMGYYFMIKQNVAVIHTSQEKYEQAWQDYQEILNQLPDDDITTRRLINLNLGDLCARTNEFVKALEYFREAAMLSEKINPETAKIRPLSNMGGILLEMKRFPEALEVYKQAEEIAVKKDEIVSSLEVCENFCLYYKETGNYQMLSQYQEKVINLQKSLQAEESLSTINRLEKGRRIAETLIEGRIGNFSQNYLIPDSMENAVNDLIGRNQDLKLKLKNAISTIKEKDEMLTAHHRLASLGEMISIIAHQWQQPLSIINALVFSINDSYKYGELDEDQLSEKSNMIYDLVKYLASTINDFRNFFKTQKSEDFTVSLAVKKALSLVNYALDKENVKVKIELDPDFSLKGSVNELVQVFLNLINNARDAFLSEKTQLPELIISSAEDSNYYYLSFYDNGGPVSEDLKDKLFEAFITTKGSKGTGLGLNICRTIVEKRFDGKIWHENTENGVIFKLKFKR